MSTKPSDSDIVFIDALAKLLHTHDLTELDITRTYGENDALKARISRKTETIISAPHSAPFMPAAPMANMPISSAATADISSQQDGNMSNDTQNTSPNNPNAIKSPMVGTAYLAPEPGAAPFVKVGDTIQKGQTIMIIEAMKTMNHIPATKNGTITHIMIDNGSPVEFEQILMVIE